MVTEASRQVLHSTAPRSDPRHVRFVTVVVIAIVCALAGVVTTSAPTAAVVGVLAALIVSILMLRIEWTVLGYVALEPFGDLLDSVQPGAMKVAGAMLFGAWLTRLLIDRRPVALLHPAMLAAGGLVAVLLASTAWHPNGAVGVEVLTRYLSYLAVLVVVVDTMRTRVPLRRVALMFTASCTAAAGVGLVNYFVLSTDGRAAGPMGDANDFAFYLVCALPFALMLWREGGAVGRSGLLSAVVLCVAIFATFSRGGLLGLLVLVVVAWCLRLVLTRHLVTGTVVVLIGVALAYVLSPGLVDRSLAEKQHVAEANVTSRFTSWTLAAEMTADHPLLGTGPGGFRTSFAAYDAGRSDDPTHLDVAHQMLLEVSSELGLAGLATFVAMIGAGLRGAWRARHAAQPLLARAVCASFAGTLAAAMFLSEQYYLPIWLLVAFGIALESHTVEGAPPCASPS